MSVSKRLRFEILTRDNHACRYCGACAPDATLTIDHVVPTTLGGSDDPSNLVTACKDCNAGKSSVHPGSSLVDDVAADAIRWRQAMDRALSEWREDTTRIQADLVRFVEHVWGQWTYGPEDLMVPLPDDWWTSVERFLRLGFTMDELERFVGMAMVKKGKRGGASGTWPYFCGIVWTTLKDLQDKAAGNLAAPAEHPTHVEAMISAEDADLYAAALDYEFEEEPLGPVVARLIWPIPVLG